MERRTRRRAGISDVARLAGVSKTAVSFAFNTPDRLRPETADRIRDIARSVGYRPNPVARMLTTRQTLSIGILTPQGLPLVFSNPYFSVFFEGVAAEAEKHGYGLHLISPVQGSLLGAMSRATVDGVIVVGLSTHHPEVGHIRAAGLPIVLVDSSAMPDHPSIRIDDVRSAELAAEHVLEHGHRAILVVGIGLASTDQPGDPESVGWARLRGYRRAFERYGLKLPERALVHGPASIAGGAAAFAEAWSRGQRPTAIVAMSDAMAVGVLGAAHACGLRVPDDLSVVGFDDIPIAQHTRPPLTTIHQPIRQKGEEAVGMLLALIERTDADTSEQRRLETRLVVRGSSGPVPRRRQEVAAATA